MPDNLYEIDALAWAEQQADLLRRLARGERLNETIDWVNVIEEVQDVGLSELRACESLLGQALLHLFKLFLEPDSLATSHWRREVVGFLLGARKRFTPSMRQKINLADVYDDMVFQLRAGFDDPSDVKLPETCPFTLDDLLVPRPDVRTLVVQLASALPQTVEKRDAG